MITWLRGATNTGDRYLVPPVRKRRRYRRKMYGRPHLLKTCSVANNTEVDYNSWQESEQGLALAATLDKDVVLAEGPMILYLG